MVTFPELLRSQIGSDQHVAMLAFVPSLRSHSPWHLVDGPPGTAGWAVDQFNVVTRDKTAEMVEKFIVLGYNGICYELIRCKPKPHHFL